jgi:hypothetical protein
MLSQGTCPRHVGSFANNLYRPLGVEPPDRATVHAPFVSTAAHTWRTNSAAAAWYRASAEDAVDDHCRPEAGAEAEKQQAPAVVAPQRLHGGVVHELDRAPEPARKSHPTQPPPRL